MNLSLKKITLSLAALTALTVLSAQTQITVTGRVTDDMGHGIAEVPVTDGSKIVRTDAKGRYQLATSSDKDFVYYTLPAGYETSLSGSLPQFFRPLAKSQEQQTIDFKLRHSAQPQSKHMFIVCADPQVFQESEFAQWQEVVDDMRETAAGYDCPVHLITAGDNIFDRPKLIGLYKKSIEEVGLPFYHTLGNHDMDYNDRSDTKSDSTYTANFGPSHYAFNVGDIHYVVLKDVFYYGYTYRYIGYITEEQLRWLEEDLSVVPEGSTVVVTMHIPTRYGDSPKPSDYGSWMSNAVTNAGAIYKILAPYEAHIMAGHSHIQWNTQLTDHLTEHVHAAACGAWWQGPVACDGTPKGYTLYEVDGNRLTWYYKAAGQPASEQFKLYMRGDLVTANVYNYDDQWRVEWFENGKPMGEMERYWGVDPYAEFLYPKGGNKLHGWLSYGETQHLFRAKATDPDASITVRVTDRFGRTTEKSLGAWEKVWSDEFDYTGLPDPTKWSYDTENNDDGWGNNEAQFYTVERPENSYVSDGTLKITARKESLGGKEYTSARLITKGQGDWTYGRFEIRAKLPSGRGMWPAIWMLPTDWEYGEWPRSGEIDIMENVGFDADTVLATSHTMHYNHSIGTSTSGKLAVSTCHSDFHTYSLEWNEDEWTVYIDGEHYYTYANRGEGWESWPYDKNFHLLLNVAVGGNWGGRHGIDNSIFPQTMEVDYVRVYQRKE